MTAHEAFALELARVAADVTLPLFRTGAVAEDKGEPGAFDPVTRAPLRLEQAVPNIALRETIREYLDEHPWAYESNL